MLQRSLSCLHHSNLFQFKRFHQLTQTGWLQNNIWIHDHHNISICILSHQIMTFGSSGIKSKYFIFKFNFRLQHFTDIFLCFFIQNRSWCRVTINKPHLQISHASVIDFYSLLKGFHCFHQSVYLISINYRLNL